MRYIRVEESGPLRGSVRISGAKNAALPILAGALLGTEPIILEEVPILRDVQVMLEVLQSLNVKIEYRDATTVELDAGGVMSFEPPGDLMNQMRASFLVIGALLGRFGIARAEMPGGCNIGKRPIDLHLKGFRALGAEIIEEPNAITARAPKDGLIGNNVYLDFPSVGATQNLIMAASLARGQSRIENAAKEPEIVDLANFLNKMGARIKGAGTSTIIITGVPALGGAVHTIIPDRIEASTFLVGAAMTHGHVRVENVIASHIRPVLAKLTEVGCDVIELDEEDAIEVCAENRTLKATKIRTLPYPGFPTDVQAQFMALMTVCEGQSHVEETVFENRFMHVEELAKMGALIATEGHDAVIRGVDRLNGAKVNATDLRAGAALVLAGLIARGTTEVHNVQHIERGYYQLAEKLQALGGKAELVER
ncbi:MAG: UDP-N-acetylglucosamine 1-carboxyvinyltransferase [Ndongobacter sp.]|nr:UDP-N-acetylglucosamine 1-carboxyvinyltransferase [Ndongobacter sp.]